MIGANGLMFWRVYKYSSSNPNGVPWSCVFSELSEAYAACARLAARPSSKKNKDTFQVKLVEDNPFSYESEALNNEDLETINTITKTKRSTRCL